MDATNLNTDSQGVTRRAVMGVGAAAAAAVLTSNQAAFAQEGHATKLAKVLAAYDATNPDVTIDFSGLRASLVNGVTWLADQIPTVTLKTSEINGFTKLLSFVTPDGVKKYVPIQLSNTPAVALTSMRGDGATDVLNTILAVYKVGQQFDVFSFNKGVLSASTEKALVNGNLVLQYEVFTPTAAGRRKLDDEVKRLTDDSTVALNVSKLLAVPSFGLASQTVELDKAPSRYIPQYVFNGFDVMHYTLVTDDGKTVPSTSLDVKKLLNYSPIERAAIKHGGVATAALGLGGGFNIDLNDIATIAQVAEWVVAAFDKHGKAKAGVTRVTGSIGISISF